MQTLAVTAFAMGLGPQVATAIFGAYMITGLSGLPLFAGGAPERSVGLAYLIGPTVGFAGLLGRLVADRRYGVEQGCSGTHHRHAG
ncbi:MAG: biotin transporter BioY [Alphaproteobacteria bacterium]|nr:biotin transporter BioY [Alphaproteobacteria bacterium]